MKTKLRITLVQSELVWQDVEANIQHFDQLLADVKDTDLVVLPEMFATGFSMASVDFAEATDGHSVSWLKTTAQSNGYAICGSLMVREAGHFYNRFYLVKADGSVTFYDKKHLFRMANEHKHYSAGAYQQRFQVNDVLICPQVCYDLRFPAWMRNQDNYQLLLVVANWPAKRRDHWRKLLQARAIENQCHVVAVNRIGSDGNGMAYSGDSQVIDHNGEVILDLEDRPELKQIEVDFSAQQQYRRDFPAWLDADKFTI